MESIICPVCETQNPPSAEHCEVCGERLSAPEPGEVLSPEENVAAMLGDESTSPAPEDMAVFENAAFQEDEFPAAAMDAVSSAIEEEMNEGVLYSPLDGTAYPEGTPEYAEGFGPMGESLVATRPEDIDSISVDTGTVDVEDDIISDERETVVPTSEHAYEADRETLVPEGDLSQDSYIDAAGISGSPQFREMFKTEPKVREPQLPLPQPGIHPNPASLSVYVNREEAHRHYIETDETLLGRRDPHSDAYPELDLGAFDENALISRKHAYVYRQNKNYTLYVVSNSGTQLNNELLSLGDRRTLKTGDVIVLAGILAIKFELASS